MDGAQHCWMAAGQEHVSACGHWLSLRWTGQREQRSKHIPGQNLKADTLHPVSDCIFLHSLLPASVGHICPTCWTVHFWLHFLLKNPIWEHSPKSRSCGIETKSFCRNNFLNVLLRAKAVEAAAARISNVPGGGLSIVSKVSWWYTSNWKNGSCSNSEARHTEQILLFNIKFLFILLWPSLN